MPFGDIIDHSIPIEWLRKNIQSNQLSHAYLFIGGEAIGKRLTALRFAQAINCDAPLLSPAPDSCGQCRSCYQIISETHPDFLCIRPDQSQGQNPQIKIDRIREIEHHVMYRPLIGQRKVCLLDDADRLTTSAANALLKTLEEPPDHSLFILVTSRPAVLLPTIQSRCRIVRFTPPPRDLMVRCVMERRNISESDARLLCLIAGLSLGKALQLELEEVNSQKEALFTILDGEALRSIPNILDQAELASKPGQTMETLRWLWHGLRDMLLVTVGCPSNTLVFQDRFLTFKALSEKVSPTIILELIEDLVALEQGIQRNLNMQLGLERFFLRLHDCFYIDPR